MNRSKGKEKVKKDKSDDDDDEGGVDEIVFLTSLTGVDSDPTSRIDLEDLLERDEMPSLLYPYPMKLPWSHKLKEALKYLTTFWANKDFDTLLIVALVAMILVSTVDSILYTRLSYKMVNYEWFLSQVVTTTGFCLISWTVVLYRLWKKMIPTEVLKYSHLWFFFIAILDAVSALLSTLPTPYIPGPLLVVIGKLSIPCTMICSYVLLGIRYRPTHYLGALFIGIGVIISVYPKLGDKDTFDSNIFWLLMFMSSGIPTAFSNVYKEKILKSGSGKMDIWYFNSCVAIYQLVVGFALAWTVFLPFPPPAKSISPSHFPEYLLDATRCFLGYIHSTTGDETCSFSWLIFLFFIGFNIAFNVLIFYVMQKGSATLAVIASTTTLALTSLGYHIPLLAGEAKVGAFNVYGVIALIVIIVAVLVYKIQDEIPKKPKEEVTKPVFTIEDYSEGEEKEEGIELDEM